MAKLQHSNRVQDTIFQSPVISPLSRALPPETKQDAKNFLGEAQAPADGEFEDKPRCPDGTQTSLDLPWTEQEHSSKPATGNGVTDSLFVRLSADLQLSIDFVLQSIILWGLGWLLDVLA